MRKLHILVTSWITVLTTWTICHDSFKVGIPLLAINYILAVSGLSTSLKRLLNMVE